MEHVAVAGYLREMFYLGVFERLMAHLTQQKDNLR
jgi:hypothetical protein